MFKRLEKMLLNAVRGPIREWQDPQAEENPMSCPEITIEGIDDALYAKLLAEATSAGAKFEGTSVSLEGLDFDWNRDSEAQAVHITCLKKPFFATCGIVEFKIRELVAKAKENI
jgi:hypothetical protein